MGNYVRSPLLHISDYSDKCGEKQGIDFKFISVPSVLLCALCVTTNFF